MPKNDPTPPDEIDESIRENLRRGLMVEVSPGQFSLTPAGIEYVRQMLKGQAGHG